MNKDNFKRMADDLSAHFGANPPTNARLRSWYDRVKDLPDSILEVISVKIKDTFDQFPRNFSKAILAVWFEWQRENPDSMALINEPQGCLFCHRGWIFTRLGKETRAFRCGHCKSVPQEIAIMATTDELESYGWHIFQKSGDHPGTYYRDLLKSKDPFFRHLR